MADETVACPLKVCTRCGVAKPALPEFFYPQRKGKFGVTSWCRPCSRAAGAVHGKARTAQRRAARAVREASRPIPPVGHKFCTLCREAKPATTEFFQARPSRPAGLRSRCRACERAGCAEWHARNQVKVKAGRRARYEREGPAIRAEIYRYRRENPEKVRQTRKRYVEKAKAEGGGRILRLRIGGAINKSLKLLGLGGKSRRSWQQILGYTAEDLARHLERQFTGRMTWANRGTYWSIDHIVPVSSFRITGPDCPALKACWHLSNLRPMPLRENIRKGAKVLTLL